jgi:hypothetical protein
MPKLESKKAAPPLKYKRNPARTVRPEAVAIRLLNFKLFIRWPMNFCPGSPIAPTVGPTKKVMIRVPPTQTTPATMWVMRSSQISQIGKAIFFSFGKVEFAHNNTKFRNRLPWQIRIKGDNLYDKNSLVWEIADPYIDTDFPRFVDVGFEMEGKKAYLAY